MEDAQEFQRDKKFLKSWWISDVSLFFCYALCMHSLFNNINKNVKKNLIIKQPSNGSIMKWSCDKNKTYEYKYLQGKMLNEKNKTVSFLQFLEFS